MVFLIGLWDVISSQPSQWVNRAMPVGVSEAALASWKRRRGVGGSDVINKS